MKKRILVVYYSQSGQLKEIADSVTNSLKRQPDVGITYEEIKPIPAFPFPWKADEFFQAFPESVEGIPCQLEPLNVSKNDDFDLVVVAWQPWYLSPSIPIHAFFQSPDAKRLLSGKPVITLIGARNMWVVAQDVIKSYINEAGGQLVGNIALYDRSPNLLTVVTIMYWMFTGKKDRYLGVFPPAGIKQEDINQAAGFGPIIGEALKTGNYNVLQEELVRAGAVQVKPMLIMFEKRGKAFFKIWSRFVLKKGTYGSKARNGRLRVFKYYLLFVLYLISPLGSLFYLLVRPFRNRFIQKQKTLYQTVS